MSASDTPAARPRPESGGSAALYRTLFEASPDGLLTVDADGRIVLANAAVAELLGYAVDELVGLPVDVLVPDSIRPRHADYRAGYSERPRARPMGTQMDLVARRRDGSEVRVEIALSPLGGDERGRVLAAIRNVGEYPRVKQALRQARFSDQVARLGALAVDTRDPQLLLGRVPEIAAEGLGVASACVYLLEADQEHFRVAAGIGLEHHPATDSLVPNQARHPAALVRAHGEVLRADEVSACPRLQPPATAHSLMAVPINDRGAVIGALCVWSDTAQTWDLDAQRYLQSLANLLASSLQRAHTEEALGHAQRLESVGQLTGGVAHDFNNLLTVIQGNLQVLQDHPALSDDAFGQQLLQAAQRAGTRAAELTAKLLAFSRRQVLRPSAVEVPPLLEALSDMLRRTLDERIRISVLAPQPGLHCLVDAGQLESALLNIAINARDAMPDGGALSFTITAVEALPADCRVEFGNGEDKTERAATGARPDGGFVAIAVSDTGQGMPAAVRERAFEPFFTTKPAGRGTGLGLSTVYGFARQSQGAVAIDSEPGQGTTITLYLPRAAALDQERRPELAVATLPQGLRVMVVEDEAAVRRLTQLFLNGAGCQVVTCQSAEEALAQADALRNCDALVTDVALGPGLRGTELAEAARQAVPGLPVLLVSGYASQLLAGTDPGEGAWPLLRKPFTREELLHHLAVTLARARAAH